MLPPSATNSFTSPTSHFCVTRLPMSSPLPIDLRTETDIYPGGGGNGSHRDDPLLESGECISKMVISPEKKKPEKENDGKNRERQTLMGKRKSFPYKV
ncbi:hypothetical protein CDAR_296561 [Caerostris darwini]|uniref:Uncharacterized protein n=1 Tax=Caerostris darwini TaxID=1538125 RepID=A0AAV4PNS9_9ARAC|nr:hypothetical protein CDAR_296561 [Caerostris darwini]